MTGTQKQQSGQDGQGRDVRVLITTNDLWWASLPFDQQDELSKAFVALRPALVDAVEAVIERVLGQKRRKA